MYGLRTASAGEAVSALAWVDDASLVLLWDSAVRSK